MKHHWRQWYWLMVCSSWWTNAFNCSAPPSRYWPFESNIDEEVDNSRRSISLCGCSTFFQQQRRRVHHHYACQTVQVKQCFVFQPRFSPIRCRWWTHYDYGIQKAKFIDNGNRVGKLSGLSFYIVNAPINCSRKTVKSGSDSVEILSVLASKSLLMLISLILSPFIKVTQKLFLVLVECTATNLEKAFLVRLCIRRAFWCFIYDQCFFV